MHRKHYVRFAFAFKSAVLGMPKNEAVLEPVANHLADVFAKDNKNFERERFLKACGFIFKEIASKRAKEAAQAALNGEI